MSTIVDTTVWSVALRRTGTPSGATVRELTALINEGRIVMVGAIRQELLSGIRAAAQFSRVRDHLRAFEDLELDHIDYENAAACLNECRTKGIQGADTDFLLCAASLRRDLPIFTEDRDFPHYQRVLGIRLHGVRAAFAR